jgi:hypothetical protein
MLPDLLGSAVTPLDLRYVEPGGEQRHTAHLILVSSNPYQLAPGAGWERGSGSTVGCSASSPS